MTEQHDPVDRAAAALTNLIDAIAAAERRALDRQRRAAIVRARMLDDAFAIAWQERLSGNVTIH